ncbi:MAG: hypothetical protein HWQ38_18900 [Nostoc sp. NMS7]|uniref:hypothetical protein n=1 Tax=Nostoc sp. NMS7 TaxID=2815391 RepID=UPI0025D07333|nr:hypothetical protein [Nostoc sp. NMS7]MBN3948405.1 hypothetical protein [Nostoc sp. NMS7]
MTEEIRTTQYIPDWWKDENRRKKVMLELTRKSIEERPLSKSRVESFLEKMRLPKTTIRLGTSLRATGRTTRMILNIIELLSQGSKVILICDNMRSAKFIADNIAKYCRELGIVNKLTSVESLSLLDKTGYINLRGYHEVEIIVDHFAVEQFIENYVSQSKNFFGYEYQLELLRTHPRLKQNKATFNGILRMYCIAIALSAIVQFLEFASDKRVFELIMYGVVD